MEKINHFFNKAVHQIFEKTFMLLVLGLSWVYSAEVHEHGFAKMEITYVDNQLEILIDSPAENILGFEHAPVSKGDKKKVRKNFDLLLKKVKLDLPELCRPESVSFQGMGFQSDDNFNINFIPSNGDSEHSDIEIIFIYVCKRDRLDKINFKTLFDTFSQFKKIEVNIISGKSSGFQILSPKKALVRLPSS